MRQRWPGLIQTPPELCGWGWGWGGRSASAAAGCSGASRCTQKRVETCIYYIVQSQKQKTGGLLISFTGRESLPPCGGSRGKWGGGGSLGSWACTEVSVCFHLGVSALFSFRPTAEGKVKTWCKAGYDSTDHNMLLNFDKEQRRGGSWWPRQ